MSNLKTQKRIAAKVLGVGETRIWVNPASAVDIAQAMTRDDVRALIEQGLIQERPAKVQTRAKAKERAKRKKKRHGVGHGKRKGGKGGRMPSKERWITKVRAQRRFLREIKESKAVSSKVYRAYYLKAKGGVYATLKQLKEAMKTEGALKPKK